MIEYKLYKACAQSAYEFLRGFKRKKSVESITVVKIIVNRIIHRITR